jgi:type II secretory pathway pseudopilin PulG
MIHRCITHRAISPRRMSRGFTLVEGLVVAALLAVAGTMFWQLFSSGMKREQKVDFRTRALQTAALTRTRIAMDFVSILPSASTAPDKATGKAVTFDRIAEDRFQESGMPLDKNLNPLTDRVTYRFDPQAHRILRNGQVINVGLVRDLDFTFESGKERGYTLHVDLTLCPEEEINSPKPSVVAHFGFSFHSPQGTLTLAHREWVGDKGL